MAGFGPMLTRRALLGAAALAASPVRCAWAAEPRTIVALDWVSGQNLLALGVAPVAMPELERYARLVVEPAAPLAVRELGLRSEPNLELVGRLKPDLVLLASQLEPIRERVEQIAPSLAFDPNGFGGADLLGYAEQALRALAARLGRLAAVEEYIRDVAFELDQAGQRLRGYDGRPLYLATIIDGRRMLVFGRGSLFQAVLDRFGIQNAWAGPTTRFGHVTLTVDRLSQRPDARLLCIGDSSGSSIATLLASPVVASLPFIRAGRIAQIPDVLFYGGLPPARRFARLASLALGLVALAAMTRNIAALLPNGAGINTLFMPDPAAPAQMLLHYTVLPRIAVALMAGAGLGLSGIILQRILRNPLAEPPRSASPQAPISPWRSRPCSSRRHSPSATGSPSPEPAPHWLRSSRSPGGAGSRR